MINKIQESLQQAGEALKDQITGLSDTAKEKTYAVIDDRLKILPPLQEYGLVITSFGLELSLNPSLEVELKGKVSDFTDEKIEEILQENKNNRELSSVISAIKATLGFYKKAGDLPAKPLFVKLNIGVPPRVQVFLGAPKIFD